MLVVFVVAVFYLQVSFCSRLTRDIVYRASNVTSPEIPLDVFQVEAPLRSTYDGAACEQVVLQHNFEASYGAPYVGSYTPPTDCNFTTVIFNMSVTSIGINYDRLGLIFLGDVEVWRTTTAMPVRTGIYYNFQKDMTIFDTLLRSDQKVIMELDNIYNSVFTGNFNITITALYYNDPITTTPAATILPISAQLASQNKSSVLSLPDGNASVSFTLPRNVNRAVVSILASGNGNEEFWYSNVPTQYEDTFNNTTLAGYGPWREVQLLIDGNLAGVVWPFPTIFTGGISPGLWVPIVGIDTYDLPNFEVDISPWLGLLCDGNNHTFALKMAGYDSVTTLGTVGSNWWVTGSIFLWLDDGGNQTTGTALSSTTTGPSFTLTPLVTSNSTTNTSILLTLTAARILNHTSTITTSLGPQLVSWIQNLTFTNTQLITAAGYNNTLSQLTAGISSYTSNSPDLITNTFSYPLTYTQNYTIPTDQETTNSTLLATLDRSKISSSIPITSYLTIPSSEKEELKTRQKGWCDYGWNNTYYEFAGAIDPNKNTVGETEQWFSWNGTVHSAIDGEEIEVGYGRYVKAEDGYVPVLEVDETFGHGIEVPNTVLAFGEGDGASRAIQKRL